MFWGDHNKNFINRRRLKSYTSENLLMLHQQNVKIMILLVLELEVNHIYIGKIIFIRILFI